MAHSDREGLEVGFTWDPYQLYGGRKAPDLDREMALIRLRAASFADTHRGRLRPARPDAQTLLTEIREYESIHEAAMRPVLFARLLRSADTRDPAAARLFRKVQENWEEAREELAFFLLELAALPDEALASLAVENDLSAYRHFLIRLIRAKPHMLTEPEERICRRKDLSGSKAQKFLYDELLGCLGFSIEMDGKRKELGAAELLALQHSSDRALRASSMEALLEGMGERGLIFSSLLNSLILDRQLDDRLRGRPSPMDRRHLENEVDGETIETMMGAVEKRYNLAQKYVRLKARMLGLEKLAVFDLTAPILPGRNSIPLPDAFASILDAAGGIHPLFRSMAFRFLEGRWIDAEIRPGKESGAFCACLEPSRHPYISLHYSGSMRDVMLLAHELGHGIHYRMASGQTYLNFQPQPILAEAASVLMEISAARHLMEQAADGADRTAVLACHIEGIIATVFRQNALTRFEQTFYRKRQDHLLSSKEIGEIWLEENARVFGEDLDITPSYRWGWVLVPHFFHLPFYCYGYVFGGLLAMALLREYEKSGPAFMESILRLLRSGGSRAPLETLEEMGMDTRETSFWDGAFEYLEEEIGSLAGFTQA